MARTSTPPETQGSFSIYRNGRNHGASKMPVMVSEAERLQMLNEVSRALTSRLDVRAVYDTVYERISRVMDTVMFFLAFRLPEDDRAHIAYMREYGRLLLDVTTPPGRSVTNHVFQLGQPLLFHSTEQYEQYALSHGLPVIVLGDESEGSPESMIFAPLNTGSETIGTISVQSTRANAYSQHDFDTLTVIASQAAIAVQNARLYEATRDSAQRHQALIKVAENINGSLTLSTVLNSVLDGIRDVLPYHLAAIMMPNRKTGQLDAVGSVGDLSDDQRRALRVPLGHGVTGQVFESGTPLYIPDVSQFAGYIQGSEASGSEVAVPLKRGDTIVGVLNVERKEENAFVPADIELLTLFATQAAIAIENARLFEDQKSRVRQMQAIQEIVQDMTAINEDGDMAAAIERGLQRLIEFDECIIYRVNEATSDGISRVEPVLVSAGQGGAVRKASVPRVARVRGEGICGWVWDHGEATIISSTRTDPRVSDDVREFDAEFSVMGAPTMHQGRVSGVITLGKLGAGFYDDRTLNILQIIAGHAAIGFDRCRLYTELQLQATTDDLTGLFNRRYFNRRLAEEMSRAKRNGHPLAAILLDADDFKSINDGFGHDAGDKVLKILARRLQSAVRTEDLVARYGGEEFLLLLPEIDSHGVVEVSERLRRLVEATPLESIAAGKNITVSIGVAMLEPNDTEDELISRADQAMYEGKKRGGNQICIHLDGGFITPFAAEDDPAEDSAA